jgi:SHS2 domain-containing protein
MIMKYRLIDHTADFGVQVFGSDAKEVFSNAALAMFDLITKVGSLKGLNSMDVSISGEDWPDLMINWLRELLFLWNGKELLVKRADITILSEKNLSAKVFFDPYDPDHHVIKIEVKAVTYHQIQVKSGPSGWEARVIFDV